MITATGVQTRAYTKHAKHGARKLALRRPLSPFALTWSRFQLDILFLPAVRHGTCQSRFVEIPVTPWDGDVFRRRRRHGTGRGRRVCGDRDLDRAARYTI